MAEAIAEEAVDSSEGRSARGMRILIALLIAIALPAAIYAIYVLGQLQRIREHNLRELENTAQEVAQLIENTRTTVDNLRHGGDNACAFFQRQHRVRLVPPSDCSTLSFADKDGSSLQPLRFDASKGRLDIVGQQASADTFRMEVGVDALLEQVPFGSVFDRLMIVDAKGKLVGPVITPQRSSPMLPPGVAATRQSPPVRVLDLAKLQFVDSSSE